MTDLAVYLILAGLVGLSIRGAWATRPKPRRAAAKPGPFPELTEGEMRAALSVGEDHLLWRAVHQSIAVQRAEALAQVQDADTQRHPALLHYYAGAAAHLEDLATFLDTERRKALTPLE